MKYGKPPLSFQNPIRIVDSQDNIFSVLTIMKFLLDKVAPDSRWSERLIALLDSYPVLPLEWMGFPAGWKSSSIWGIEEVGYDS